MTSSAHPAPLPGLYAIPVGARWLVWAPATRTAAVVNRSAVASLSRASAGDVVAMSDDLQNLWHTLISRADPVAEREDLPGKLVILPTRACNMRCVYCDFSAADALSSTLAPRLACLTVDYVAAQLREQGQRTLRVHFFGGEPLVARTCVETVVHYVRALCARTDAVPWFELTTNGFFDPGVVPFVGDYMDSVVVSLDGAESLHDYNRRRQDGGGTYAQIAANIRRLAGFPVELCLRTCVTNRSQGTMVESAARFCEEFKPDVLSFEMLAENSCASEAGLSAPDALAFAAGVLKVESLASKQGVRVVHGPSELTGPRLSSCPLGRGTLMLSPGGQLTACYLSPQRWVDRGLDLTIGHVDADTGVHVDKGKLDAIASLVRDKPRCARCFCRHSCAGGCHIDQTYKGCSPDYDHRCRAIRVITAARILRRLGCAEDAEMLVDRRSAAESLVNHPDDRLACCWRST